MFTNTYIEASAYFNANWNKYKDSVNRNMLFHREMFAILDDFLCKHFLRDSFSLMDIGCGDSSMIAPILKNKSISKYIGVDAAPDILKIAANNLANLKFKQEFICENMLTAVANLPSFVDVIFSSYAIHHLSAQEKYDFINCCKNKLAPNQFFLMIDGILLQHQTRDKWLDALAARFKIANPDIQPEEVAMRMEHPRASDYPETISFFENMAKKQGWKNFQVLTQKEIFAFMAFTS